jgi:hypothetical protein
MKKIIITTMGIAVIVCTFLIYQEFYKVDKEINNNFNKQGLTLGKFGKGLPIPQSKYPNGFPIEILNVKDTVITGQRMQTGFCRWHTEADSIIGCKVAVVPVELYDLDETRKTVDVVNKTITRSTDGYFELSTPKKNGKYTICIRIEQAENCPEKFKHTHRLRLSLVFLFV